jgi:NADPH:quinone reductase-like Zn-dependent oxidoreductase
LALANQGIVYIYGNLSESATQIPVLEFYPKMASIKGYGLFSITLNDARRKVAVEYILKGLASGALKPVIDRTFKFEDMVEVHRYHLLNRTAAS